MKTRERKEDAVADDKQKGDITSSARVDDDPMSWTSFGDTAEPLGLTKCSDDALVNKGAEVPKSRLSPVEMCTSTPAGGLLHAGSPFTTPFQYKTREQRQCYDNPLETL